MDNDFKHMTEKGSNDDIPQTSVPRSGHSQRDTWGNKLDFLFAALGYMVGLGNVWRFPFLCYMNGGGVFLIPYFMFIVIGGIPLYFLEIALGQFMSVGGLKTWEIYPPMKGIFAAVFIATAYSKLTYSVIMAWTFYYLFNSFISPLPWTNCYNSWNTNSCAIVNANDNYTEITQNMTSHQENFLGKDSSMEFWERKVLAISGGIDEIGTLNWDISLCLLVSWTIVFLFLYKGIKISGKIVYFTALAPYALMLILLIRSASLPGALSGVKYYLYPDFSKLAKLQVWIDASSQVLYSLGIGSGTGTAMASYNKFNHNCWRDSLILIALNSATSLFAGFVVFSTLGFMAHENNVKIADVAESGPGLVFIAYPKAISQMPFPHVWSVLLFVMLIFLCIDSLPMAVEANLTAFYDQFPSFFNKRYRKVLLLLCICTIYFSCSLPLLTNGGIYLFHLLSYYAANILILSIGFLESVTIAYFYGANKFYKDVTLMLGFEVGIYIKFSWLFSAPLFVLVTVILCAVNYREITYNKTYIYPSWTIAVGWLIACSSIVMIPLFAIAGLYKKYMKKRRKLKYELTPTDGKDRKHTEKELVDLIHQNRNEVI